MYYNEYWYLEKRVSTYMDILPLIQIICVGYSHYLYPYLFFRIFKKLPKDYLSNICSDKYLQNSDSNTEGIQIIEYLFTP